MSQLLTPEQAAELQPIIAAYTPSQDVVTKFQNSNFAVIAGPAGAGKDTLRNSLIAKYPEDYQPILSTTTRPMRLGEVDGETYHFATLAEVNDIVTNQQCLQVALIHRQQLSVLSIAEVEKLNTDQYGLSILIVQTEQELREHKPDVKTIFVIPPSYDVLLDRINAERKLEESEVERRLTAAKTEIQIALDSLHYYCLRSDTVEYVTDLAHAYLQSDVLDEQEDAHAREVMAAILKAM